MSKYGLSIEERKRKILDEMMAAGAMGFTGAAPAEGPTAGFDPVMGTPADKALKKLSEQRNLMGKGTKKKVTPKDGGDAVYKWKRRRVK